MKPAFSLAIFGTLAISTGLSGQSRPDFTGRWKLDAQATEVMGGGRGDPSGNATGGGGRGGGGLGLGPPAEELIVRQNDTTMTVEEVRSADPVIIVYKLKGGRIRNTLPVGRGGTTVADFSSRWDGSKLSTNINREVTARGSTISMRYRELRYLSKDSSMVVETTMSGRPGGRKTVYRKVD